MSSQPYIPDQDPNHPRWLLDLENWTVFPCEDVKDLIEREGYGIVSYTWGKWADFDVPVENAPEYHANGEITELPWKIPTVEGLRLSHVCKVLQKCLRTRFIWWDWMCVPQGQRNKVITLPESLNRVKGQEVAKQLKIYQKATEGFVWLHCTTWSDGDSLRLQTFLRAGFAHETFEDTLNDIHIYLQYIQESEPWLTSGWTLQEGVLLQQSILRDYHGEGLPRDFIFPAQTYSGSQKLLNYSPENSHQSYVMVDQLSLPATGLADDIASAFLRYSEGWTSSRDMPQGVSEKVKQAIDYLGPSDERSRGKYVYTSELLTDLIRSGLVCYWPGQPTALYLLSGVASRRFGMEEDKCWALLGALDLTLEDNKDPVYNYDPDTTPQQQEKHLREVKNDFFKPLLKVYQWELFLVPKVEDPNYPHLSWPERVVHGGVLPLSLFFASDIYEDLPRLEYSATTDEIICSSSSSGCTANSESGLSEDRKYVQLKEDVFIRRYRQRKLDPSEPRSPRGFIEVDKIKCERTGRPKIYLPVMKIPVPDASHLDLGGKWEKVKEGKRCVEFELAHGGAASGYFEGIVDIWGPSSAFEKIKYEKLKFGIKSQPSIKETGWCVMS